MQERRNSSRKTVSHIIEVLDRDRAAKLGVLVNISSTGLLLLCNYPVDIKSVLQLSLKLPQDTELDNPIEFGCETLWAEEENQQYWTGLQIIDISDEMQKRLNNFLQ